MNKGTKQMQIPEQLLRLLFQSMRNHLSIVEQTSRLLERITLYNAHREYSEELLR